MAARSNARSSALVVAVVLGGCDLVIGLEPRGDSGVVGDAAPDASESTTECFVDMFPGPDIDPRWMVLAGMAEPAIAIANSELQITPLVNVEQPHFSGIYTRSPFDFTGGTAQVSALEVPLEAGAEAQFGIYFDDNNFVVVAASSAGIAAAARVAGVQEQPQLMSYDRLTQGNWRLVHVPTDAGGNPPKVLVETSASGSSWQTLRTVIMPAAATTAALGLAGGTYGAVQNPGVVRFDNVRLVARRCP